MQKLVIVKMVFYTMPQKIQPIRIQGILCIFNSVINRPPLHFLWIWYKIVITLSWNTMENLTCPFAFPCIFTKLVCISRKKVICGTFYGIPHKSIPYKLVFIFFLTLDKLHAPHPILQSQVPGAPTVKHLITFKNVLIAPLY